MKHFLIILFTLFSLSGIAQVDTFHVTGTTTITSITTTNLMAGTIFTIIFDGTLTFTDGSNLKLAGDFTTSADATITLRYDGTNFYEMSRSIN